MNCIQFNNNHNKVTNKTKIVANSKILVKVQAKVKLVIINKIILKN